jgi:PleD family two-component response regulator
MTTLQTEHLGVAIVADDAVFGKLICARISQQSNFALFQAGSAGELFEVPSTQKMDCLILDYDLGNEARLAIKKRVDESEGQHPPTIMMTGNGREGAAIRAFRIGVHDYLPKKDLRPEAVIASVLAAVERDRKEALAKAEYESLAAPSSVDFVTGLEARVRLDERLRHLAALAPEAGPAYALIGVRTRGIPEHRRRVGAQRRRPDAARLRPEVETVDALA